MNLKRLTVALASALFVVGLVGPAGTALAAGGDTQGDDVNVIPLVLHDPDHDGGENPGDNADDPGDPGSPGGAEEPPDVGDPGDHASDPRHDDSGDDGGDSGGSGPCAVAAGPVAVCVDQPR